MEENSSLILVFTSTSSMANSVRVSNALESAFVALGYPKKSFTIHEIEQEMTLLEIVKFVERIDPLALVALDDLAGKKLRESYESIMIVADSENIINTEDLFIKGEVQKNEHKNKKTVFLNGRKTVFLEDFESSLENEHQKRKSWERLKALCFEP